MEDKSKQKEATASLLKLAGKLVNMGKPTSSLCITFDDEGVKCEISMAHDEGGIPNPVEEIAVKMFALAVGLWSSNMMITYSQEELLKTKFSITKNADESLTTVNTMEVDDILDNLTSEQ